MKFLIIISTLLVLSSCIGSSTGDTPGVPDFCGLELEEGFCRARVQRFYYDPIENKCLPFNYGGCGGNKNRFRSKKECEETCQVEIDICGLERETGDCRAFFSRFYYDATEKKCLFFGYGGCGGNKNNFKTKEECEETCPTKLI